MRELTQLWKMARACACKGQLGFVGYKVSKPHASRKGVSLVLDSVGGFDSKLRTA